MLSKYILSVILIFSILSCSKSYERIDLLHTYTDQKENNRKIASSDKECFVEQFEINRIKEEIVELEKRWDKRVKVPDQYHFATFKNAETHYIARYSEFITLTDQAKSCKNLPCILNATYGNKHGEEGYRIYHWFLTMETGISTSRKIPGFKDDNLISTTKYLFPNKELKFLNIISNSISKKYRNLFISTLHRFPDGTGMGGNTVGRYNPRWSYNPRTSEIKSKNPSTLFLTKQVLEVNKNEYIYRGHFKDTVVHELTHALDFFHGAYDNYELPMMSDKQIWTKFSWKWNEALIPSNNEKTIAKWVVDETKEDGFLRSYQRTDPGEDFADSGAHYFFNPDEFKKISPNKYKFLKNKFYYNKGYSSDDLVTSEVTKISSSLKNDLWEMVKNCLVDKDYYPGDSNKISLKEYKYLDADKASCLESKIEEFIAKKIYLYKKNEYYGCLIAKKYTDEIYQKVYHNIRSDLDKYLEKLDSYQNIQKVWTAYRKELKNKCDSSHIYLDTRKYQDPVVKYKQELQACVDMVHDRYPTYGHLFIDDRNNYLISNNYNDVKDKTIYEYSQVMLGFKTFLNTQAINLVNECNSHNKDEKIDKLGPIYGQAIFVNASTLNCLNKNYLSKLDDSLMDFLDEKYNLLESGLLYLTETYTNVFIYQINNVLNEIYNDELMKIEKPLFENKNKYFIKIYEDLGLISELYNSKNTQFACQTSLKFSVKKIVKDLWDQGRWPITISLNEISNKLTDVICPELLEVAEEKHSLEVEKIKKQVFDYIYKKNNEVNVWTKQLQNEQNFHTVCIQENEIESKHKAHDLIEQHDLIFVEISYLKTYIKNNLCRELDASFQKQITKIREESQKYSKRMIHNLDTIYDWQITLNREKYINSCLNFAQVQLDKEFLENDSEFMQLNLVSTSLILKFLASDACKQMVKIWDSTHLENLIKYQSAIDKKKFLEQQIKTSENKEYIEKYFQYLTSLIIPKVDSDFKKLVEKCKDDHKYIRFEPIKLKRKQCLQSFFEKDLRSLYLPEDYNEYHSNIKKFLDNRLYDYSKIIESSIETHMK